MTKNPVPAAAEVSVLAHSTEDETKVRKAVTNVFPQDLSLTLILSSQILRGHYSDRITLLKTALKKEAAALLRHVVISLSLLDRVRLLDELESRMDSSGNLYVRLSKQQAFLGRTELCDSDPIRIKLRFRSTGRHVSARQIREALEELTETEEAKAS